jgi:homogentisate phytyltransferase/homogentisate geranylgeranyltransferase
MTADRPSAALPILPSADPSTRDNTVQTNGNMQQTVPFPIILWRFTRPHTILGSALAIPALHALAAPSLQQALSLPTLASCAYTMVPSLLMNLYITGLNQVTDVDIDRINKPNLPIAAGLLTPRGAVIIITIALILSLSMGMIHPTYRTAGFNLALWGSMILGTLYSLPPFRLKRFPLMAALCIVAVRGTIINSGFFAHARSAVFAAHTIAPTNTFSFLSYFMDPKCILSSLYFAIFGTVIGKDDACHF